VYASTGGPVLVGALELVSPANKDRGGHRQAFLSKCEALLGQRVGLLVVDVVTSRRANLHRALLERLGGATDLAGPLYAAAYRVETGGEEPRLEGWEEALAVGGPLPSLPLWLLGGPCLPVELQAAYARTCREQRLPEPASP